MSGRQFAAFDESGVIRRAPALACHVRRGGIARTREVDVQTSGTLVPTATFWKRVFAVVAIALRKVTVPSFTERIAPVTSDTILDASVCNDTRDFPFAWEEIRVRVSDMTDLMRAEGILLDCAERVTKDVVAPPAPLLAISQRKSRMTVEDMTPHVCCRLTANYLELTVRFIVGNKGSAPVKGAITGEIIREFDTARIQFAAVTADADRFPPICIALESMEALHETPGD
jgi:hypothetical protein